jgi:hypothetical protein
MLAILDICSTCLDRTIRYSVRFGYRVVARLHLSISFVPTPPLGRVVLVTVLLGDCDCN